MDIKDVFIIIGCLAFMGVVIYYIVTADSKKRKVNASVPEYVNRELLATYPRKIEGDELKRIYRFNFKRLLLLNAIFIMVGISVIVEEFIKGDNFEIMDEIKFMLVFSLIINFVAILIDVVGWIRVLVIKDKLYEVPIYLHGAFNGWSYISYQDISNHTVITKNVRVGRRCGDVDKALMKIDGDKIKYIRVIKDKNNTTWF